MALISINYKKFIQSLGISCSALYTPLSLIIFLVNNFAYLSFFFVLFFTQLEAAIPFFFFVVPGGCV